jgi:hypothetical protein
VNKKLSIIWSILATQHSGSSAKSCNVSMAQVVAPGSHLTPSSYAPHGKKRAAEGSLENEQRLSKRFDLLNLGTEAPFALYFPSPPPSPSPSPSPSHADTLRREHWYTPLYSRSRLKRRSAPPSCTPPRRRRPPSLRPVQTEAQPQSASYP